MFTTFGERTDLDVAIAYSFVVPSCRIVAVSWAPVLPPVLSAESSVRRSPAPENFRTPRLRLSQQAKTARAREIAWPRGRRPPLSETQSPQRAENDDAGHMQRPARKTITAHLRLAHGVKEKLKIPRGSGQRAQTVIPQHRNALFIGLRSRRNVFNHFAARGVNGGFERRLAADGLIFPGV